LSTQKYQTIFRNISNYLAGHRKGGLLATPTEGAWGCYTGGLKARPYDNGVRPCGRNYAGGLKARPYDNGVRPCGRNYAGGLKPAPTIMGCDLAVAIMRAG